MRISGYGTDFFDQPSGGRDRAAAFRQGHSIGQRVRGRILRPGPNGLLWVLIGETELLARLEVPAGPGETLFFVVRALEPEIILQALAPGQAAADLPGLLQRFRAAREVFEQQAGGLFAGISETPPSPARRRQAFGSALAAHPEAGTRLGQVLQLLGQINAQIDPALGVEAAYPPWILPGVRRIEAWRNAAGAAALSGESPVCGGIEVRLSSTDGQNSLHLLCGSPKAGSRLLEELAGLVCAERGQAPQVGLGRLVRPTPWGGVLGELLGEAASWSAGGVNTRV